MLCLRLRCVNRPPYQNQRGSQIWISDDFWMFWVLKCRVRVGDSAGSEWDRDTERFDTNSISQVRAKACSELRYIFVMTKSRAIFVRRLRMSDNWSINTFHHNFCLKLYPKNWLWYRTSQPLRYRSHEHLRLIWITPPGIGGTTRTSRLACPAPAARSWGHLLKCSCVNH